jgi:hypothetical protein
VSSEINNKKLYKIGYTRRNIHDRIKEFKTGNASSFEVVSYFESKWGTKIEKNLHKHFIKYKVDGEWFDLSEKCIIDFNRLCKLTHDNLELIEKYNTYIIDRGGIKKIKK